MKLIEYLPLFLRNVREFNEIFVSEDMELNTFKSQLEGLLKEVIVTSAKSYGLERYEKIYNINNNSSEIEERRFNILNKMNSTSCITYSWLISRLDNLVGKGNYTLKIDYENYNVLIEVLWIYDNIVETLTETLRKQLPANLEINVNIFQNEKMDSYFVGFVHQGDFIRVKEVI